MAVSERKEKERQGHSICNKKEKGEKRRRKRKKKKKKKYESDEIYGKKGC
jgi:hypothetical protein